MSRSTPRLPSVRARRGGGEALPEQESLEFDDTAKATAFREALYQLWRSPMAAAALMGEPRARIVEAVESGAY